MVAAVIRDDARWTVGDGGVGGVVMMLMIRAVICLLLLPDEGRDMTGNAQLHAPPQNK